MKEIGIVFSYVISAFALTMFGFQLAKWTRLELIPSVVTVFISFPLLVVGVLRLYWGSYEEIPPVAWIGMALMMFAAVLFGIGMLLN